MWPFPKIDPPPVEITEEQKAAMWPWATLQLSLMGISVVSGFGLLAFVVWNITTNRLDSKQLLSILIIGYLAISAFLHLSIFVCSSQLRQISGMGGPIFPHRYWKRLFFRWLVLLLGLALAYSTFY